VGVVGGFGGFFLVFWEWGFGVVWAKHNRRRDTVGKYVEVEVGGPRAR